MTKVQVIKRYRDIELSTDTKPVFFEIGDTRDVTDKRAKELVAAGVVEVISIVKEKKETKKPAKKTVKKTTKKK